MAEHSTLGQNVPKSPAPPEGLFLMDGIEGLRSLPQHSVDMLLTDPPYGTTRNFWDVPLPLPELWEAVRWAVKPEGAVLFFAQCPYDKVLGASNARAPAQLPWPPSTRAAALSALKPPRPFTPRPRSASGWRRRRWRPGGKESDYRKLFYHLRRSALAIFCKERTGGGGKSLPHNGDRGAMCAPGG